MEGHNLHQPDLWVLWYRRCKRAPPSIWNLLAGLKSRAPKEGFTFREVPLHQMALAIRDGQPVVYLDSIQLEKKDLPKVAFAFLPAGPQLSRLIPVLRHLESLGVRVVNSPKVQANCLSKFEQMQRLMNHSIPMPDTFTYATDVREGLTNVLSLPELVEFPAILKHTSSGQGKRVMLVEDKMTLDDLGNNLFDDGLYLLQDYVKDSHGSHVRAVILGRKIYAFFRYTNRSSNRVQSNAALGGTRERIEVPKDFEELALKIADILEYDFTAIDFLEDSEGNRYFIEANTSPGIKYDDYIIDAVIDFLLDILRETK